MANIISKGYSIASQVYGGLKTVDNFIGQYGPKEKIGKRKSIDGFVSNQLNKDLARKAHFRVRITPPSKLTKDLGWGPHDVNDKISMMCMETVFPDISSESTQGVIGTDNEYSIANNLNYATWDTTFLCDTEHTQRRFFEDWMKMTYVKNNLRIGGSPNYYDNYIGSAEVFQLKHNFVDDAGFGPEADWTYKMSLKEVYPITVNTMDAGWDSSSDFHKLTIIWHFKSYDIEMPSVPQKMQESQLSTLT